jgi:hypothetical protein
MKGFKFALRAIWVLTKAAVETGEMNRGGCVISYWFQEGRRLSEGRGEITQLAGLVRSSGWGGKASVVEGGRGLQQE